MSLYMPQAAWIRVSSDPEAVEVMAQYLAQPMFISQSLLGSATSYLHVSKFWYLLGSQLTDFKQ